MVDLCNCHRINAPFPLLFKTASLEAETHRETFVETLQLEGAVELGGEFRDSS